MLLSSMHAHTQIRKQWHERASPSHCSSEQNPSRARPGERQWRSCSISHLSCLSQSFPPLQDLQGEALGAVSCTLIRSLAAGKGEGAATRDPQLQPGLSLDVAVPRRGCTQQLLSPSPQPPEAPKSPNQQGLQMFCLSLEGSCDGCLGKALPDVHPTGKAGKEEGVEGRKTGFSTQEVLQIL